MLRMQTLDLSGTEGRSDGRVKSLLWPSIQTGTDVDYIGVQGYWVCTFVAGVSFVFMLLQGRPLLAGTFLLFYYFGGVGVRERDLFAAAIVFGAYALDTLVSLTILIFVSPWGMLVMRVIFTALLLSNLRATWIAANWQPSSEQAAFPPRQGGSWSDVLADLWPAFIWPKVRIIYYIFACAVLLISLLGIAVLVLRVSGYMPH